MTPLEELKACEEKLAHWTNEHFDVLSDTLAVTEEFDVANGLDEVVFSYRRASEAYIESVGPIEPRRREEATC